MVVVLGQQSDADWKASYCQNQKKYGLHLARNFLGVAAPELLKILEGSSKPKEAFGSAENTTIRKQLGRGRSGTFRKLYTSNTPSRRRVSLLQRTKKRTVPARYPGHHFGSGQTKKTSRVKVRMERESGKKTVSRKRESTTTNRGPSKKSASKKRSRNNFFTSIVDAATR